MQGLNGLDILQVIIFICISYYLIKKLINEKKYLTKYRNNDKD